MVMNVETWDRWAPALYLLIIGIVIGFVTGFGVGVSGGRAVDLTFAVLLLVVVIVVAFIAFSVGARRVGRKN